MATNRPFWKRRMGGLEIACFEWEGEDNRLSHTTKLTYSFRRRDSDNYENSDYLPSSELLTAAKLFDLAHTAIIDRLDRASFARKEANVGDEPAA